MKRLFGTNQNDSTALANAAAPQVDPEMEKFQKVFADNDPPALTDAEPIAPKEAEGKQGNLLSRFLNDRYYERGFSDGFQYHSMEVHAAKVERIINEYLEIVEITINDLKNVISQHEIEIERCSSDDFAEQCKNLGHRVHQLRTNIEKMEAEKDLAPYKQGLVAKPLSLYKEAFIRGVKQYQEEKIFAQSTGLFN